MSSATPARAPSPATLARELHSPALLAFASTLLPASSSGASSSPDTDVAAAAALDAHAGTAARLRRLAYGEAQSPGGALEGLQEKVAAAQAREERRLQTLEKASALLQAQMDAASPQTS